MCSSDLLMLAPEDDELVILRGKHEVLKATYKVTKLDKAAPATLRSRG